MIINIIKKYFSIEKEEKSDKNLLLRNKADIENWLDNYNITHYKLIADNKYGYVVNVIGNVSLSNKNLKNIEVKFNIIQGNFDCSCNFLTSLEGCPNKVMDSFYCYGNQLKTLEGGPNYVENVYNCYNNELLSLKGVADTVYKLLCYNNKLTIDGIILPKNFDYIDASLNCNLEKLQEKTNETEFKDLLLLMKKTVEIKEEKENLLNIINKENLKKQNNIKKI